MADILLRNLNEVNKFCKRFYNSYIIWNDYIIGYNEDGLVRNTICRLTTRPDVLSMFNQFEGYGDINKMALQVDAVAIANLFKNFKSKELDEVSYVRSNEGDAIGEVRCVVPDGTIVPFANIIILPNDISKFTTDKLKELNNIMDRNICYELNEDVKEKLLLSKQILVTVDNFQIFISKKLFPTIKRKPTDTFTFYFDDVDHEQFKCVSKMTDEKSIMDIYNIYHCVHF